MKSNVVYLTDIITRRQRAQERYFDALAQQLGFPSFDALAEESARAIDLELEEMARKRGFVSFDAYVAHEKGDVS